MEAMQEKTTVEFPAGTTERIKRQVERRRKEQGYGSMKAYINDSVLHQLEEDEAKN